MALPRRLDPWLPPVLPLLFFLWWRALQMRMSGGRAALVALLLSSAYAATDELHQTFVAGRRAAAAA